MADDDQVIPAQNEPVVNDDNQPAPPADEPQPAEPEQDPDRTADEPADEPADTVVEEQKPSRTERRNQERESRIRELNQRVKQYEQHNQPLQPQSSPQFPNYQPGEEVSPERLQQDVVQTADAIANLRVQQQLGQFQAQNDFTRDVETLPTKYEELQPESTNYTPELDEAIAQEYQERAFKVVGYHPQTGQPITQLDPSVRLADIAERHVKSARAYAAKASANMRQAVNQSADTNAPRPGGDKPVAKEFKDLSITEMEAALGFGPQR